MSMRIELNVHDFIRYLEEDIKGDKTFPAQDRFVYDRSQFIAAICTRRAGKTNGLARRFKMTMDKFPGTTSRYIALTRDSAKEIMWPVLHEMDDKYEWGAKFTESDLTMTLPNGSRLRLFGADMKNFIKRLRGVKNPAVALDEVQDFGPHITELISDVIEPTLADFGDDAWLGVTGTPGPIPKGLFYDITQSGLYGYSVHRWSLYDNPYMPNPRGFVEGLKKRKGWDDKNPTYLREYCGQWVLDLDSLLIKYDPVKNHYDQLPHYKWNYLLGVDIGHRDSDALSILAWSEKTPNIYLVEEQITPGQDLTALENQMNALIKKYQVNKIVMDEGGLGKKIGEEFRRRKHIPVHPADKARKMENVAFLNDWMRQGKFFAKKDSRFAQDSYQVQIDHDRSTADKIVVKKGFHSDAIDSTLYAFKESPAFTFQAEPPKLKYGTEEWANKEQSDMESAAIEYFENMEQEQNAYGWD